jgi:hypothetical protein
VGCLYCGKEIGTFRVLRDSEFCSAGHRKSYGDRLGRALDKIGAPDPAPAGIATFQISFPIQEGNSSFISPSAFLNREHLLRVTEGWPVSVAPALGGSFLPSTVGAGSALPRGIHLAGSIAAAPQMRMPRFELAAMGGLTEVREAPAPVTPPACESWMPTPPAQPAERFLEFAFTDILPSSRPLRPPAIDRLPLASTHIRGVYALAPSLQPEPALVNVWPVLDSRPIAYGRSPAHLRFSIHAVEEIASHPPVANQAPELAGARPGLSPMPVESMPALAAFAPVAIPPAVSLRTPDIGCIATRVLPQAQSVESPAAAPVESMPSVALAAPVSIDLRPTLRFPTLAHFQPVEDPSEALALPAIAPGPSPVESMPKFAAFAAVPSPAVPALLLRSFQAELRAEFGYPVVAMAAPLAAAPPAPLPQSARLDPMSRIAAQPAGMQPERPKPAIPHPAIIPLEYYCQRINSVPVKRIESMPARLAVVQQPFTIPAALGRLEDLLKRKPTRIVLPFEELFAKRPVQGGRINITATGKIAASVMVGLALWAGSRMANLSQHTEELKAQVAASERTVAVAESHGPDPILGNFGAGPVGKLRRAIADRAATEITDTFRSGMAAWGAEPKTFAAGWKRHPEGYVSTGDMALFQPSLKYTDYHMEFYGQIEDKSLGWVVRAQDKKNYYAMKVTVIEPGLRPIVAMVHYGVTNGKPGRKFETPLNVMVHNNRPLHVDVDVRGNRFTASIEGEQVESWNDDTLAQGGVGFFSDTGEKARLYWMKLSRNQDWVGRFCAYISGDGRSKQQTAELWGPEIPHDVPEPVHPRPEMALAPGSAGLDDIDPLFRDKTAKYRRSKNGFLKHVGA